MAHLLVQQQQTHRTPSINIRSSTSKQKDSKLPMVHSVDDRLFLHDSTQLLHLITRFASEPHICKYQATSTSTNSNGHCNKSSNALAFSTPVNHSFVQVAEPDKGEIHFENIFHLNCDKIQPVLSNAKDTSFDHESSNDKTDNQTPVISLTDETDLETPQSAGDDTLIDLSPLINTTNSNNQESQCERHFRRRKRRSSLTKTSISSDDSQPILDLLDKLEVSTINNTENLESKSKDNQEETATTTTTTVNGPSTTNEPIVDEDKSAAVSRFRGRSSFTKTTTTPFSLIIFDIF